ncbi:MAG: pyruvate, phosphate dikinase [Rhodospirillaceae bacterium]|nr:pyruvate, phosphate dikinase [Rhodospirillaceae bacterium]|tara:strand:+ start:267 stop:2930 length:2664 start_codon:yes stop_codon:yes gene_type:complete
MDKWVYSFGANETAGDASMRDLLGGKGANLAEMSKLGLPVPPGFSITTEVCTHFYRNDNAYPDTLKEQVNEALCLIESEVGCKFGNSKNPLLVSVRSGARVSMPGMMDTVLNLGLNKITVEGLAKKSDDTRFAYDSYRRFIQMYGDVVLGIDHYNFEEILDLKKDEAGVTLDTELTSDDLKAIIDAYEEKVSSVTGKPFPQDPVEQLWGAIGAVFSSWMVPRAVTYRKLNNIPENWGTAVNIQAMVFGNMGDNCATGVAFTRDPSTGENIFYGEYLVNAQGEDVVAGIRTPQHLTKEGKEANKSRLPSMEEVMPQVFDQLKGIRSTLEQHYTDMQDIEFTVQQGKLYMLQTRAGKRTTAAALKIAVDMVDEGLITNQTAISRIEPSSLDQLLHPTLDPNANRKIVASGLPASPGAASGKVVFDADEAERISARGEQVILVRIETSPEDIHGMHAAEGILTTRGGMTSHAAVVARGMGRPCVAGAGELRVDYKAKTITARDVVIEEGEEITLDGASGDVMVGRVATIQPEMSDNFQRLMTWADDIRCLKVRTNAETPTECRIAREFGAEGVGLCRTEHMFFESDRIIAMREMIVSNNLKQRRAALAKLLPMQMTDFQDIFRIMKGLPITIRLLDPPLHEFLPKTDEEIREVAEAAGVSADEVRRRAAQLEEANPMLGHRGCRLGVTYPEISAMQARAIFEAALSVKDEIGEAVQLEIMVPLVATGREIEIIKEVIDRVANDIEKETGDTLKYIVGTMIELPRAALCASEIAKTASFFSFGTNDLTQTAYGLSRDDAGSFSQEYEEQGVFSVDPFVTLDREGVGELVRMAAERGRSVRPDIKLGICGEHGGDPSSIQFCAEIGLDYVSCSPFRVPIARLALAQAAILQK